MQRLGSSHLYSNYVTHIGEKSKNSFSGLLYMNKKQSMRQLCKLITTLYAEYIIWNAGLDESQAGIKIARKNINSLTYADDTTLMAESKEELKSLLMKVKEESEKVGLKLNI